jgi:hypothetical protein
MKHLLLIALPLLLPLTGKSQEVLFFSEGTTTAFYDQGIVDKSSLGSSTFEYTYPHGFPQYNDKIPCSPIAWKGKSALKFNYTSSPEGNWKVTLYRNDWSAADISEMDSLVFHLYSPQELPSTALPLIAIKAMNKSGQGDIYSKLYALREYNGAVPANQWTRITFPLEVIRKDTDNNNLNFSTVKGILFSQSEKNNISRLLYMDELMAFKHIGVIPPVTSLSSVGYDSHTELKWILSGEKLSCRIYASFDGGNSYMVRGETTGNEYLDFLPSDERNKNIRYRVVTLFQERESLPAETMATVRDFSDNELLEMLQEYTFRYFWEGAHQESGMALERSNGTVVASGATGMGLMAMIAAHEREFRPREEVKARILKILTFLETCDRHHGAWSHWYNASTGKTQPFSEYDDGGDLVETSFVAQALVALRNYFTGNDALSVQIREKATLLFREIDWEWYRQGGQNVLYWHWSPNHAFRMGMKITGWNECMGTYLMAASSPTHSIPKEVYSQGWARNGDMVRKRTYYNQEISLSPDWGGPLFWIHYSHLGIDPRGLKDQYAEYWKEHTATVRIHHAYAVANPQGWKNYSEKCWGLTASDDPYGYTAHQPVSNDNGTISPTAALASMPYAPAEAIKALKYFYRERGSELWGKYGPRDAFNDQLGWVRDAWLGIDQGPIMVMTENYRSALLWNLVMNDPDVKAGLQKLGFQYDPTTTAGSTELPALLTLFPNPCSGKATIVMPRGGEIDQLQVFGSRGEILLLRNEKQATISPAMECGAWPPGIYLVKVTSGKEIFTSRLVVTK